MNLTKIIVYKHRDQQSVVCLFNTKAQCAHTCVVVLSPDSMRVKYFMTLCMFELNVVKPHKLVFKRKYLFK